tara:strand:+ start:35 stop:493 length:459 start_codon:yes stop_codon:yes gene_type:complete
MIRDIIDLFLISISPLGEAKVAIPIAIAKDTLPTTAILLIGILGNLLIFPLFYKAIEMSNYYLLNNKFYRKSAIKLSLRARRKTKNVIGKFGAWGLMVFVMIPLPFTGAYIGTIASYIFGISYQKSLFAISIGIIISCIMIAYGFDYIITLF